MMLKPWNERKASADAIGSRVQPALGKIPGTRINIIDPNPLNGGSVPPVEFVIKTTGTYEALSAAMDKLLRRVRTYPGISGASLDMDFNTRKVDVQIDRLVAANLGIDISAVGQTLNVFLGGQQAGTFQWNGDQYKVLLQVDNRQRQDTGVINNIYLRASNQV